jgi:hypothetical protein
MKRARQQPAEELQLRSRREPEMSPWLALLRAQAQPKSVTWMKGPAVLKDLSGDHTLGICGVSWCGWNGDRTRGWGFYCACGFCTPMRRSFSEGIDALEVHWMSRRSE